MSYVADVIAVVVVVAVWVTFIVVRDVVEFGVGVAAVFAFIGGAVLLLLIKLFLVILLLLLLE